MNNLNRKNKYQLRPIISRRRFRTEWLPIEEALWRVAYLESKGHHCLVLRFDNKWLSSDHRKAFLATVRLRKELSTHEKTARARTRHWDHRKSTDGERLLAGLKKTEGKRLTYKTPINAKKPK
jgi:short subunit dehydrogenase-like uncharacterized protein